jgi:hypothetical protein
MEIKGNKKMKTIYDVLKYEVGTRLSCAGKWLVMDELNNKWEFVVYCHKHGAMNSTELYRGDDEEEAIRVLIQ